MNRRLLAAGLLLGAGYVVVADATLDRAHPLRPFFDGNTTPRPYQWVVPPPEFADVNIPPEPVARTIAFIDRVIDGEAERLFEGGVVGTPDAQVSLSIPSGVFPHIEGATGVEIGVTPLDPASVGPPPAGTIYDGNAIEVVATYEPGGQPATLTEQDCAAFGCLSVILRYPTSGTAIWRWDGSVWIEVPASKSFPASFSIAVPTLELGTFVVTAAPRHTSSSLTQLIAFIAGGVAVAGAIWWAWFTRRRSARRGSKRSSSTKPASRGRAQPKRKGGATRGNPRR